VAAPGGIPDWAADLFSRISIPRLAGSAAVEQVELAISERLGAWGYAVERRPFATSPRRLVAARVATTMTAALSVALWAALVSPGPRWAAAALATAGAGTIWWAVKAVTAGRMAGIRPMVEARNLIATHGTPGIWLVAHSDSKRQPLSLAGRVSAAAGMVLGALAVLICLVSRFWGPVPLEAAAPPALLLAACALALSGPVASDASPGAIDNATGIIAVLVAAERLANRGDVGVLITGAEEFGMEGARAWIAPGTSRQFINFDGIDGVGAYNLMSHGSRDRTTSGPALASVVGQELRREGPVRAAPLPLGIFVDGAVLAGSRHRPGMEGVTVSRGTWATLRVIHTIWDLPGRVSLQGAVGAGEAAARAVARVLGER